MNELYRSTLTYESLDSDFASEILISGKLQPGITLIQPPKVFVVSHIEKFFKIQKCSTFSPKVHMETNESGDDDQIDVQYVNADEEDEKTFKYSIVSDDKIIS